MVMAATMSNFFYTSRGCLKIFTQDTLTYGVPRAFADFINQKLESRQWSLRDLASAFDRDADQNTVVSHLSKMLKSKIRPKPRHLEQLADALRLDGDERAYFIFLGHLAASAEIVEEKFLELQRRVARLEAKG